MKPITDQTPRRKIKIGGLIFDAPTPFSEGDVLTANEAAALNQTYLENVGNNFRSQVEKAKRAAIAGKEDVESLKAVTDVQLKEFDKKLEAGTATLNAAALQHVLDSVVAGYTMGIRRSSSVEVLDPVEKEARSMAKAILADALKKKGIKLNTVKSEWYDREIDKLLAEGNPKGEVIRKNAERRVKLANQTAAEEIEGLDFSDATKPAEPAPAAA